MWNLTLITIFINHTLYVGYFSSFQCGAKVLQRITIVILNVRLGRFGEYCIKYKCTQQQEGRVWTRLRKEDKSTPLRIILCGLGSHSSFIVSDGNSGRATSILFQDWKTWNCEQMTYKCLLHALFCYILTEKLNISSQSMVREVLVLF
jgi:hypothetical protein